MTLQRDAVSVKARRDFATAAPRLFRGHFEAGITARSYDVWPDGQRFVMIKGPERRRRRSSWSWYRTGSTS